MNNAQILTLQCDRQLAEPLEHGGNLLGRHACKRRVLGLVGVDAAVEEPARAILGIFAQQIDFVVAQHRMGRARGQHGADQREHRRAVRSAVAEVADKHQSPPFRVMALQVITQVTQQLHQRGVFAMDIANDIEGARRQGLD